MNKYDHKLEDLVSADVFKFRLKTCRLCRVFVKEMKVCGMCGCFMPAKARVKDSDCPMSIWNKVE